MPQTMTDSSGTLWYVCDGVLKRATVLLNVPIEVRLTVINAPNVVQ